MTDPAGLQVASRRDVVKKKGAMLDPKDYTTEALCRSMLDRHSDTISVRKPEFAVRKLKIIIEAALDLSNSGGFQAMSLRDLSAASGVSMGGLYAYFDSKTTLLRMILTEVTEQINISGTPATLVEAVGEKTASYSVFHPVGNATWFYKISGPSEAVTPENAAFRAFLESIQFPK